MSTELRKKDIIVTVQEIIDKGKKLVLFLAFFLSSCCKLPEKAYVSSVVSERSGYQVHLKKQDFLKKEEIVQCFLNEELTIDTAVQIALLQNPRIKAMFEEVGISEANLVNASLIANPMLEGAVRFPDRNTPHFKTELNFLQPFVDILLQPIRRKTYLLDLYQTNNEVADHFFRFIEEVKISFYHLQEMTKVVSLYRDLVEVKDLQYRVAQKQVEVGNLDTLLLEVFLTDSKEAFVNYQEMLQKLNTLEEEFTHLLGLEQKCWKISLETDFPYDTENFCKKDLLDLALLQRLDLQALEFKTEKIAKSCGLYSWWAYTKAEIGVSYEKETDGEMTIGPGFFLEIPIFNFGQGDRLRVFHLFNQSVQEYFDKRLEIFQEIGTFYENLSFIKKSVGVLSFSTLPARKKIIDQTIRRYNFMNAGVYEILDAKANEIMTEIHLIHTSASYWMERAHLVRAIGGGIL